MQNQNVRVTLTLTPDQAHAVSTALDVYMRLCLGQLHIVGEMIRDERIPLFNLSVMDRQRASLEVCDEIDFNLNNVKRALGYQGGRSLGVGHPHLHQTGIRSYEVMKAMDKVLAEHRNPNPVFRGVNYDGLTVRFTTDPAPVVTIQKPEDQEETSQAYAIADRSSIELLASESMRCDEHGLVLAVIGKDGTPLQSIAEAHQHIQEAVAWLVHRKLATVVAGPEGDEVVILVDGEGF